MTYDYVCTGCGHQWEAEQRISAAPLTDCPECKEAKAKRQISAGAGFILKGSGWYSDGYSSSKPAEDKKSETKTDSAKTETTSPAKTETSKSDSPPTKPSEPKGQAAA